MGGRTAVDGRAVCTCCNVIGRCTDNFYRIGEIENKIGAGLIEEVIQVAEGEFKLANTMLQAKVYVTSSFMVRLC
jgi:hypothetical protein